MLIVPFRVIIISAARVYLVVEGQWRPDSSWNYNPMLAIENAEIGGTLIALSIPGLKPLFDRFFKKVGGLGLHHPYHSHPPSFNVLNPSAMFASEASKTSVMVEDRALGPHPLSNPWATLGGVAHYGPSSPRHTGGSTTSAATSAASIASTTESTSVDDLEAAGGEHGTVPPNP